MTNLDEDVSGQEKGAILMHEGHEAAKVRNEALSLR